MGEWSGVSGPWAPLHQMSAPLILGTGTSDGHFLKLCHFNGRRKESVVSQTLQALDFSAPRSKKDADLLYEAKYGQRGEDGKVRMAE